MAFSESFLTELAERNEIEDVVSSYVRLTKRSGSNLFGLCPFHNEKTPSFSVSPDKQIYHCFGCGKGGSVIGFIMEIENLSFTDAVYFLARRAGLQVPQDTVDVNAQRRERMLSLNRQAARFFYDSLRSPQGKRAQEYVAGRGISMAMVKSFGLGYAPDSWDGLMSAMTKNGFSQMELIDAGLARPGKKQSSSAYDTFRDRLMFPVIDVRGNIIGFSGRSVGDAEPKYMNSPETLIFNKSRNLFALNLAKKSKIGYIILTEGNIDVVSLHQAGFDSAVASLGTSLTQEQARLMSRYTDQVIICYDSDEAGKKAAARAISILEQLDIRVRVLELNGAKDPDEFIKLRGADAFAAVIERSANHIEYRLGLVAARHDTSTDEGRVSYLREATAVLSEVTSALERQVYSSRVAEAAGVTGQAVEAEVERLRKMKRGSRKKTQERGIMRPAASAQPGENSLRYKNVKSARAEEGVIRLMYLAPELFTLELTPSPEDFSSELLARLFAELKENADKGRQMSAAALQERFTPQELAHLTKILQVPEALSNGDRALTDYINIMKAEAEKRLASGDFISAAAKIRKQKGFDGQNGR